jgi:hypothetical protein
MQSFIYKKKSQLFMVLHILPPPSSLAAQSAFSIACTKACKTTTSPNPACPIFKITSFVKPLM